MAKLHELIAVESSLRAQAEVTRNDLRNTFEKKRTHFVGIVQTFHSLAEGVEPKEESKLGIQTTVAKELGWITEKVAKAIDTAYQIDIANTIAKADIVMENGQVLLSGVPVTALLQLEKRVKEIHELVVAIPTLDPTKGFELDPSQGEDIYRAREVDKPRTEKKFDYIVMVDPTDKHPAQVKELMLDKVVGRLVQQEWSSLITVAQKGDMLDRVESLMRAIKAARSRGNEQEIDVRAGKIGRTLLGYVFGIEPV